MSGKAFAAVMGVLAVVALLGFGVIVKGGKGAPAVGEDVPEMTLSSLDGKSEGSLADYRGQWVLVNVWASWCEPCRDESPALQNFYEAHKGENFTVLGVDSQDTTEDASAFVDEFGLTYPHLHDGSGDYAEDLGTTGVPESFLVDPDGNLAHHFLGPVTKESLDLEASPLLEGGADS